MSLSNDFKSFSVELVKDCEERCNVIIDLRKDVDELLEQISVRRAELSREMWQALNETRINCQNEVRNMLKDFHKDRRKARRIWEEALKTTSSYRNAKL